MSRNLPSITRRAAVALFGAAGASVAFGGTPGASPVGSTSHDLSIMGRAAEMWITPVSSHTLRISVLPIDPRGGVQPLSGDIVLAPASWPAAIAKLRQLPETMKIPWGEIPVSISPEPLRITVESPERKSIQQVEIDSQSGAVHFSNGHAPLYGLGEGGRQFDRRGLTFPMKHGERVPDLGSDGARMPVPWLIGTKGWALFFHRPFGTFNLSGKNGLFQPHPGVPSLPLDFFLVVADQPRQILAEYARLTGYPHMPPVWALGYQQSHRTLASREEVMDEAATFRQKKLPCDVLIYLGTGFCPSGWNRGHGSYEFNPAVFPDPAKMIDEMHRKHFRIVLHEDKPPKQLHGRASDTGAAAKDP
ncbi:MAG: TIM-barrel domain-containing protein, partial [Terriglobia bacterium]